MKPVDTKTRRDWRPYWCNHKLKAIRLQCLGEFGELDGYPVHRPAGAQDGPSTEVRRNAYQGVCREIDRRWAEFCTVRRDLDAYRREVARQTDGACNGATWQTTGGSAD